MFQKIKLPGSTLAKEVSSTPIEEKLETMLEKIEGVGEVSILLTYKEDKPLVVESFRKLLEDGVYRDDLYTDL